MMRILAAVFWSFLILAGAAGMAQTKQSGQTAMQKAVAIDDKLSLIEGRVIRVVDGDTIELQEPNRAIHTIRLQAIDAPEEKQTFGKKSRKNLSELILDKDVNVVVHKKDQNGTLISSVYLVGRDIGLLQVEWGMAWHYKQYGYEQTAESRKKYAQAEAKAREDRMGLWEKGDAIAPWEFRGDKKAAEPVNSKTNTAAATPVKTGTAAAPADAPVAERKYLLGPRGGCYYVGVTGRKIYVKDKALCSTGQAGIKP